MSGRIRREELEMRIFLLREAHPWHGKRSGYDRLFSFFEEKLPENIYTSAYRKKFAPHFFCEIFRKTAPGIWVNPLYNRASLRAELETYWRFWRSSYDLLHVTYVELQYGLLAKYRPHKGTKTVGTVHNPPSWWRLLYPYPKTLSNLDAVIVVSGEQKKYFETFIPGRVFFVPHGVDIDFFKPIQGEMKVSLLKISPRFFFCGSWLRDFVTMERIISAVVAKNPHIQFDLLIPNHRRKMDILRVARHSQVVWHTNVTDERLLELYHGAKALVLPLLDSTANNTLLEAIACGLPVVTTDIGGVRDYTDVSFAERLAPYDIDGYVEAILRLAEEKDEWVKRSVAARKYAEENLSWDKCLNETVQIYQKVLKRN